MEEENLKIEKTSSIVPALGLLGLGIGIIALALGIISMIKVGDSTKAMNEKIEQAAAISLETKKISDKLDSLAAQIETVKTEDRSRGDHIANQVTAELKKVYDMINQTRENVSVNRAAIEELAKRPAKQAAPAPVAQASAPDASPAPAAATPAPAASSGKVHKIQSGDTFAKIAKKYNVSLDAIIKANPNLNPSKLQIDQEVVIP